MNLKSSQQGPWAPFQALLNDRGARLMLITAAIWAVCNTVHKLGMAASSPLFYGASLQATLALTLAFLGAAPAGRVGAGALEVVVVSLSSLSMIEMILS